MKVIDITPRPTADEAAAIAAALKLLAERAVAARSLNAPSRRYAASGSFKEPAARNVRSWTRAARLEALDDGV